ncbi:MAG: MFS transporter [Roseburia sp.]|nr:MFS transporter [Roseburia sp.]MCM1098330.1 MFS transporter [Ruminococcus flavefaciens]
MEKKAFQKYIILWISQSISGLGSSMTGFALVLWAYGKSGSAMSVSLMSFCNYVPYIILSLLVGGFVDRHRKKTIMLASDAVAAVGSLAVLALLLAGKLELWNIYVVNAIVGVTNAFQQPASAAATGRLVPKEKISNVSGMNSFSQNLIVVFNPMIAAFFYAAGGLGLILAIDLLSFFAAFLVLLVFIPIPEEAQKNEHPSPFAGVTEGFAFLRQEKGLLYIMLTMALINFFSRLTYENILSPMILARSAGDSVVLGTVNAFMGAGGIVGGILVSLKKESRRKALAIYGAAALSFLFGDLMMAAGRNVFWWSAAAVAASLPIPFIMANQNAILYRKIPAELQGRVFAVRNAIQFSTIPAGILLGGYLADYVFEPFMRSGNRLAEALGRVVGTGEGSGMAVMFLCTGICGFTVSALSCFSREIRKLNEIPQ